MLEQSLIDETAAALADAHARGEPYHPLGKTLTHEPLSEAYRIQDAFCALQTARGAGAVAGYKIALTTPAMQSMCGVDQPCAGVIFASRVHRSPARMRLGDFQHVGVEFEVAVRLGADLAPGTAPHDRESVRAAVAACMPAFELVEDRRADYARMDAFSLVADNAWNGGNIVGEPVTAWAAIDLVGAATRLRVDGEPAGEGRAGDALGHPFEAVAWLANLLNGRGRALESGMLIMTGSSIRTAFPEAGAHMVFCVEGLGSVELRWSA